MGDRSPATVTVYACPPQQAAPLAKVIRQFFESIDWEYAEAPDDRLHLAPTQYTDNEMNLGIVGELAPLMIEAAPHAVFQITSDPYFDTLGDEYNYDPTIGSAWLPIDGSGRVVFGIQEITKIIEKREGRDGTSDSDLVKTFETAMGFEYYARQQSLRSLNETTGQTEILFPKES